MPETIKTYCARLCGGTCGIVAKVRDGRLVSAEGDPDCVLNEGYVCPKGRALPELLNHPERLTTPLRRVGEKGSGRWCEISVDEALDTISGRLWRTSDEFGAESILLVEGALRGLERHFIQRFASVLGTPNTVTTDNACHAPRTQAARYTSGRRAYPDYDHPPRCLLIWGRNSFQTSGDGPPARFRAAIDHGTRFIVIDPRKIALASRADLWLKPRPGSDGLLALGMLHVIVSEGLYDKAFVGRWTVGFERFQEFIAAYPPDEVAERTWVPSAQLQEAARLYATTKPAAIQWGNALDQTSNAFQACRAIVMLEAITGNLDVPGGGVFPSPLPMLTADEFGRVEGSTRGRKRPVGSRFVLAAELDIVPSQEASRAILAGEPYPIKAALIFGSNPLLTYANAAETYEAFKKLDFLVVAELFMTPTAELADIVLPVAADLEYDTLVWSQGRVAAHPKIVDPPGACLSDPQWLSRLAARMGFGAEFWDEDRVALDAILRPGGLTFEQLASMGVYGPQTRYRKHETEGFLTPSGKVELFSQRLESMGLDPLPVYHEPPQTPYGAQSSLGAYPLVLTNCKNPVYYQASHRGIPSLRKLSPEPLAEVHPETAARLGLHQGDRVYIETRQGRIRQRLRLNADLDPRVVVVALGWWFPERGPGDLYGWREANLNLLTDSSPPHDPAMGSPNLRGLMCKVYKA
jgi:anaerobic selenocysteine-containing dehydrogenase